MGQLIDRLNPATPPDPNLLRKHMEHVEQIRIDINGWDDIPLLMCQRPECMVEREPNTELAVKHLGQELRPTKFFWCIDIYGFTVQQVVEARDKHLAESRET